MRQRFFNIYAILALGFVLRVIFIFLAPAEPLGDAFIYSEAAKRMADGLGYTRHGYPFAIFPVGWPAFLALIYRLTDDSLMAARLVNVVLSVGIIGCIYLIARRIFRTSLTDEQSSIVEEVSCGIALLFAVYPNYIAYTSLVFTEIFFTAVFYLGITMILYQQGKRWQWALIGAVFGVAVLTKPQILFVPLLLIGWQWWQARPPLRKTLQGLAILYGVLILVLVPWLYRNYSVFGTFVFVSTNGGYNLYIGNNPQAEGFYNTTPEIWAAIGDEDEPGPAAELQRTRTAQKLALEWMRENPRDVVRLWLLKGLGMYRDNTEGIGWATNGAKINILPLRYITWVLYPLLWVMALAYPIVWRRQGEQAIALPMLPLLVIAYFTAITMVFFADERFSFPVVPFVFMYSVATLVLWLHRNDTIRA